jgi:protease I
VAVAQDPYIRNAGGNWVDKEVVQDGQITTSRKPQDLPAFIREMLKSFSSTSAERMAG